MSHAFGAHARAWARSLGDSALPVIAADMEQCVEALAVAMRFRSEGRSFAVAVSCDDELTRFAKEHGDRILDEAMNYDARNGTVEALANGALVINGFPASHVGLAEADDAKFVFGLLASADVVLVRSRAEHERVARLSGTLAWKTAHVDVCDDRVPRSIERSGDAESIVVWAPDLTLSELRLLRFALEPLRRPIEIVCRGGRGAAGKETIAGIDDAAAVLARAAMVLDANTHEPSSALALARLGIPLATCAASGAHELLAGTRLYDFWNAASILAAVCEAPGVPPPSFRARMPATDDLSAPLALPSRGPVVSVVIDAPDRDRMRQSVHRQTYAAIETIVVEEDAAGRVAGLNAALEAASGEYVTVLSGDGVVFPDHIAQLVDVAERAGAAVVHSIAMNALLASGESEPRFASFFPGSWMALDRDLASFLSPFFAGGAPLVRRDALEAAGPFDAALAPEHDYDMYLRLASAHEFAFADRVTALYAVPETPGDRRSERTLASARVRAEVYRRHPAETRPDIIAERERRVRDLEEYGPRYELPQRGLSEPVCIESLQP